MGTNIDSQVIAPKAKMRNNERTSSLELSEKNQIEIFSVLIILLGLEELTQKSKHFFSKPYPYSFGVCHAIEVMQLLKLAIELSIGTSTISYAVKPDLAFSLLRKYFAAHIIHCPVSRTDRILTESMNIQITPKGTALVYNFCKSIGLGPEKMPPIVKSHFNSVHLFSFERSPSRSKVLYSEYLIHILLTKMMGPAPNVWSPRLAPPIVKNMFNDDKLNFTLSTLSITSQDLIQQLEESSTNSKLPVSPFHHKYFTNPESDAHIQYYESFTGVRVYHNKVFKTENRELTIEYAFTGKSITQWLLDCTMLSCVAEALEIGNLLLRYNLLVPITLQFPSRKFSSHKEAYYILSEKGEQACQWNKDRSLAVVSLGSMDDLNQDCLLDEENMKKVSLRFVLSDPGMRYLFKLHMEKERCSENLNAYIQLIEFAKLKGQLSKLIKLHSHLEDTSKKKRLAHIIESQTDLCYSMAFHLYLTYLSLESLYGLNIDFGLRQEANSVMRHAREPGFVGSPTQLERQLVDYMKTPTYEKLLKSSLEATEPVNPVVEHPVELEAKMQTVKNDPSKMLVAETVAAMSKIYNVFGKIASSIYRLMEVDSYPKFVRSDECLYAIGIETHRS